MLIKSNTMTGKTFIKRSVGTIFSVKMLANVLQDLVECSSDATDTGGFVNLSTVTNKARILLMFLLKIKIPLHCSFVSYISEISLNRGHCETGVQSFATQFGFLTPVEHFTTKILSYQRQPSP
ncbi:hypothetical protein ILYODFUR_036906 [Ilyodon furcidens]|uniref:HTH araC/xylS-type domain-containing protein n=1 Tax=Ilyodon furcidens TaxID=33524 RepID=A0ABV0UYD8_9TELE